MLLSTAALVQSAPAQGPSPLLNILFIGGMFVVFYFLLIRPQQQARKKHQEMVNSVRRGDTVVTGGGVVGKVTKVIEGTDEVMVELAEGMQVRVIKGTLSDVRSKTEPAEKKAETKETK